jgi:hypothetical protein
LWPDQGERVALERDGVGAFLHGVFPQRVKGKIRISYANVKSSLLLRRFNSR